MWSIGKRPFHFLGVVIKQNSSQCYAKIQVLSQCDVFSLFCQCSTCDIIIVIASNCLHHQNDENIVVLYSNFLLACIFANCLKVKKILLSVMFIFKITKPCNKLYVHSCFPASSSFGAQNDEIFLLVFPLNISFLSYIFFKVLSNNS